MSEQGHKTKYGEPQSTPTPTTHIGDILQVGAGEGYQLIERIGSGNFGEVWKAKTAGGMVVALKIITWPMDHPATQRELTSLDVVKAKELRHPFLLTIQAFHEMDDRLVVVMNLADCSVRDRLNQVRQTGERGIPPRELLQMMREAAEALDYLNSLNVQHRDIKPENLLLLRGHVQLADLGLARLVEAQHQTNVSILGTPFYMAPEVWHGDIHTNTDQYSLAISYLELRCGVLPYKNANTEGLLVDHLAAHPEYAVMSMAEQQVLLKAGSRDPADRYATCTEFVQALEHAVDERPAMNYRKITWIGKGSLGDVWKGEAPGGIPVAIKVVPLADRDKGKKELAGLDLIKSLSHPHLIKIYAYWMEEKDLHIAMELADSDLRLHHTKYKTRGDGQFPIDELLKYMQQTAEALDYLHEQRIIHRDVKPENILLCNNYVRVADFSLAKLLQDQKPGEMTATGTMNYMAPEVWAGTTTAQSDQYSLAATYVEMRLGRPLFVVESLVDAAKAHLNTTPDLHELADAEQKVLLQALAKKPDKRFATCQAFVHALRDAFGEYPQTRRTKHPTSGLAEKQPSTLPYQAALEQDLATLRPSDAPVAKQKPQIKSQTLANVASTPPLGSLQPFPSASEPAPERTEATDSEKPDRRSRGGFWGIVLLFLIASTPLVLLTVKIADSYFNEASQPAFLENVEQIDPPKKGLK